MLADPAIRTIIVAGTGAEGTGLGIAPATVFFAALVI